MSMLDVISGAMAAFILLTVMLMPYYKKETIDAVAELKAAQAQLAESQQQTAQAEQQLEQTEQQLAEAKAQLSKPFWSFTSAGKQRIKMLTFMSSRLQAKYFITRIKPYLVNLAG